MNVTHTLSAIGRPIGNEVAEHFIQTLKIEAIYTKD